MSATRRDMVWACVYAENYPDARAREYADEAASLIGTDQEELRAELLQRAQDLAIQQGVSDVRESIVLACLSMSNAIEREAAEAQTRLTAARVAAIDGLKE